MDKSKIKSNVTHKLAAVLTAGVMAGSATSAFAQNRDNFSDVSGNIVTSAAGLPSMIHTVAYVGGIGLGVAGIFKLKNHVDNPSQTPMKDGLVRLGSGGGLLALPYLTNVMANSVNSGGDKQGYVEGTFNSPTFTTTGG